MEDLDMTITQYNTCVSVLFAGYSKPLVTHRHVATLAYLGFAAVLMQVPSNLVVSKIKWPGVYICAAVALWGVVSACTALVTSFGGLVACRFMLGFVEGE
jgi:hypothetical protein